jgi:hypothetical protein
MIGLFIGAQRICYPAPYSPPEDIMIKPNMPNLPGMGAMTETLDFMKNMWGNMGLPGASSMPGMNLSGMVMPTLSVDEINKRIADLKAVESWLGLNMNMLRSTIQALEVQAATISTLQSMSDSFTATMSGVAARPATGNGAKASNGSSDSSHEEHAPERKGTRTAGAPEPSGKDEADAASLTAPLVNAAAWWNLLQDQFKQAVGNAMASEPAADKPADKAKPKAKAKPAASGSSTTARKRGKSSK